VPALFVPYPYAVDDHQTANAKHLVNAGGAQMVAEKSLVQTQEVVDVLCAMAGEMQWREMRKSQISMGKKWGNATQKVAQYCEEWLK